MRHIILATAMTLLPLFAFAGSYDKLWRQVEAHEDEGKPKSACAVVEKILQRAQQRGDKGQQLTALIKRAALRQEWAPDSFFTDITDLETRRRDETSAEARAVYASILAGLYEGNRHRSQAHDLELSAADIREWTTEQYDSAAADNWRLSVADIPALARARSREWLPLVEQNDESSYFSHDLLHILWHRLRDSREDVWHYSLRGKAAIAASIRDEYLRIGNREAALLVAMDWARLQDDVSTEDALEQLREEYADLQLCAEVYITSVQNLYDREQRASLCRECLRRYPSYKRIGVIRNLLNDLQKPHAEWQGMDIYYPGRTYRWPVEVTNASTLRLELLRLPGDMHLGSITSRTSGEALDILRQRGTVVGQIERHYTIAETVARHKDTIEWKAYDPGVYAVILTAVTDEPQATKRSESEYALFRCTRLQTFSQTGFGAERTVVVDAMTGHPIEGAQVEYSQTDGDSRIVLLTTTTDAEGRATLPDNLIKVRRARVTRRISFGGDTFLPEEDSYPGNSREPGPDTATELRLYADRAIYRPGQTVRVGGILFDRDHWDATVCADRDVELRLLDANGREVGKQTVKTDAMGKLSADFVLPPKGLPGTYSIRCSNPGCSQSISVEEYKRPTFEVTMDEAPELMWPQDSITLTGTARGYNGVAVRQARVSGTYRFTYPFWWWGRRFEESPRMPFDTTATDSDGRFAIRVPLADIPKEALVGGMRIEVEADVLSAVGETRQGHILVPLCTKPLRLQMTVPEQQDRDAMEDVRLTLLSSTEKPVDGTVEWAVYQAIGGKRVSDEPVLRGTLTTQDRRLDFPTSRLAALPSGQYELYALATAAHYDIGRADSAEAKGLFIIFGMSDTKLPRKTDSWLYCRDASFGPGRPAHVQVGTSFEDVAFYYSIVGGTTVEQHLVRLSDEMRTIEIPYLEAYGDGATLHTAFVRDGNIFTERQALRLQQEDKTLRWEWTSFRDRLRPGQAETWTLRLTRPDGSPADAQLMATIYDASLDALRPHAWQLAMRHSYYISSLSWSYRTFFQSHAYKQFSLPMRTYDAKDMLFDAFDEKWFRGLSFSYGNMLYALREEAMPMPMAKSAAAFSRNRADTTSDAFEASVQTVAEADEDEADDSGRVADAAGSVRANFAETAAFMPRLMADADGRVTLRFTLPESLTTWQLIGVAHTPDMMSATIRAQATARKDFMAQLFLPRFLRDGDEATLRASVQNLTSRPLSGNATLEIFDPETERILKRMTAPFKAAADGETVLSFDYAPAELPSVVAVRLTAKAGTFTDGEQRLLPILPSKTWITESVELHADSAGTFTTDLTSLFNHDSPTATNRRLTVEYTTNPIWYALQALPSLRTPQHDDVISLTCALYAEALATYIANTTPRLRTLTELWQREQQQGQPSLASRLAEDEELKQIILDETPWLREAESDAERKARLIELFDQTSQATTLGDIATRLRQRQAPNGAFAWFPGMMVSELMTRIVAMELTHLRSLTDGFATLPVSLRADLTAILSRACTYLAAKTAEDVVRMKEAEKKGNTVSTASLMYLDYVYVTQHAGITLDKKSQGDVRYLLDHLRGSVAGMSNSERARAAQVLRADGRTREARTYFESLLEHSTTTPAHGTFFDTPGGSFVPTGNKLIVHVNAMEAAADFGHDLSGMRRWLLQQKRTQMWESSVCTTNAIYALLLQNRAALDATAPDDITLDYPGSQVAVSRQTADASVSGLGFVKQQFADGRAPRSITIGRHTAGEAWGSVFATYLTPLADASATSTGLNVRRELSTPSPAVGDRVTTRYVITADRDYEYVCLSTPRPACAEPAQQLSGYEWQGGLGYYRAVRDSRTDYFFDSLPKGAYVLEETSFIDRAGNYSTGLATLKCLYAPEYTANTASTVVTSRAR